MPARRPAAAATHSAVHHNDGHHRHGPESSMPGQSHGVQTRGRLAPSRSFQDTSRHPPIYEDDHLYSDHDHDYDDKLAGTTRGGGTGLVFPDSVDEGQFETLNAGDTVGDDMNHSHTETKRNPFKNFMLTRQHNPLYGKRLNTGAKICEHPFWEPVCLFLIVMNGIWIGVALDRMDPDQKTTPRNVKMVEYAFCAWFSFEIICRIWAYHHKCSFFKDPDKWQWNVFDLLLVLLLLVENILLPFAVSSEKDAELPALSSLRLFRLLRIVRVMRMIPELAMMVRSLIQALRTVAMTFILAVGIMYVFSIILTQWARDYDQDCKHGNRELCIDRAFGTIPRSFLTLLQILCHDDTMALIRAILDENVFYGLLLIVYILIAGFTVMNMLIGVITTIVRKSSEQERQELQQKEVRHLFSLIETDASKDSTEEHDKYIRKKDLQTNEHIKHELAKAGVEEELLKTAINLFEKKKEKFKGRGWSDGGDGLNKEEFINVVDKLSQKPHTQDILLIQAKLELLAKAIESEKEEGRIHINMAGSPLSQPLLAVPAPEEVEMSEENKAAEEEAMESIARGMTELESQVASMLDQALEAANKPRKLGDTAPWDLELRRLDAAMSRLRVRLERCIEERGPSVSGQKGQADYETAQLASSEFETWRKLCREVVQSISAASSLMAQAIKEVEPEVEPASRFRNGPNSAEI